VNACLFFELENEQQRPKHLNSAVPLTTMWMIIVVLHWTMQMMILESDWYFVQRQICVFSEMIHRFHPVGTNLKGWLLTDWAASDEIE
jgi:hypothetical protein